MKKQVITFLVGVIFFPTFITTAQNVGINANGAAPHNSAMVDIDVSALPSNNKKGLLIPRISLTSSTDVSTIPSPAASLLVYNTGTGGLSPAGYYYWDGSQWVKLVTTGGSPSDAWLTTGNAGTNPTTNFIGTTDNQHLVFRTNNTETMRILSNGNVGIGPTTPNFKLEVNGVGGIASINAAAGGGTIIRSMGNSWANHDAFVYANTEYPAFLGFRARGTSSSPTYPQVNDNLMGLWGRDPIDGYSLTGFGGASIFFSTTENWSSTAKGSKITFQTTPNGTNNAVEVMRITHDGKVAIGTTTPVSSAQLDVTSSNKGVIFPRIPLTGATDNVTVPSPIDGIMVYNTSIAGIGTNAITPGYYYWQNNRWNKLQTSGYAGVIFGVHNPTTPNHLTTLAPGAQYTGAYIDLPPGKWVVYIYELISPSDAGYNNWDGSIFDKALWVKCSLSNSNTVFNISSDIIGSPFASGALVGPSGFGMVSGAIYVYNNSGTTKTYYLWAGMNQYNTTCGAHDFATTQWGENQFFAIPAE